jgi:hypothetical protein
MRHPLSPISLTGRILMATLALPVLAPILALSEASIAAPGDSAQAKYPYPEEMVTTYIEECSSAGAGKVPANIMRDICTCTIEEFQNTYSLTEFRRIGEAIEKGRAKEIPPEMGKITETCVQDVLQKPNA